QQLTIKREAFSLALIGVDYLFQRIEILSHMSIPHQVDSAESPFAQQALYDITIPAAAVNNCPRRKCILYLLHISPPIISIYYRESHIMGDYKDPLPASTSPAPTDMVTHLVPYLFTTPHYISYCL